ncbi:MAG: acetyl/propionyl/methylcrotonyl-CoA carboxylase subunit alpha [Gammaproteobacteria bacterium]|nr:acetyl/propionyl/methylcrotonyl-CoA carboxylase subunit alpha [Gammaproteobacteria bacterium]
MFSKILIANRGEIACRVIRTARNMGIRTVAVYSDADLNAMHVAMADEAVHIGASVSAESYLRGDRVIDAALSSGAEAIHPGYGFLSENAEFARQCEQHQLVFIGPPVAAIESMGSKSAAKRIMEQAGVPLVPGYHGEQQGADFLKQQADEMGYPVLLKAVAGGGGKGMRQVWSADEFDSALNAAKSEAMSSFGDDVMLVEKYLTQPRHVEVQVFCDQHGNGVYLFERDCSLQRRHQKIIEEAPAPGLTDALRQQMGEAALKAAQAIDYEGAGTVEFLLDVDGAFYFMEMNTRLQVEHPVTEFISGEDLVEWQLLVAAGDPLPKSQAQLQLQGHAFEARIYAEDPDNNFLPMTGRLVHLSAPEQSNGVRIDTGVREGDEVSPFYDPMIAKLVVWDESRKRALTRMSRALSQYQIAGVKTNIEFLRRLFNHAAFQAAELDTNFIERHSDEVFQRASPDNELSLTLAGLYLRLRCETAAPEAAHGSPWQVNNSWRANQNNAQRFDIDLAEERYLVSVSPRGDGYAVTAMDQTISCSGQLQGKQLRAEINDVQMQVTVAANADTFVLFAEQLAAPIEFALAAPDFGDQTSGGSQNDYCAPMNGTIIEVAVIAGQEVAAGDTLVVMEAMKMQHSVKATEAGVVSDVFFAPGDLVDGGAALLSFAAEES